MQSWFWIRGKQIKEEEMNNAFLLTLSFACGVMVVIQGGLNSKLGVLLNNPLLATTVAFTISTCLTMVAVGLSVKRFPLIQELREIPTYL